VRECELGHGEDTQDVGTEGLLHNSQVDVLEVVHELLHSGVIHEHAELAELLHVGGDGLLAVLLNGNVQGEEVRLAASGLDSLFGVLSVCLLLGKIDEGDVCTFSPARRRRGQPTVIFCGTARSESDSRHENRDRSADTRITTSDQDGLVFQQAPALVLLQIRLLAGVVKVLELGPVGSGLERVSIQEETTEQTITNLHVGLKTL